MDKIRISDLEVFAHHGVFQEENQLGQKFLVSADIYLDTREAGKKDDLKLSLDYGTLCHDIKDMMEAENFMLIEAVAEHLGEALLLKYEMIEQLDLEIKKPWAPILLPIDTVSVSISRKWHTVYLSIGSNMGDKEGYLDFAIDKINQETDTKVTAISEYIVTEPYGDVEQDDFLNGCLKIRTLKTPVELLAFIHSVEAEAGRERTIHWGPRTLDIDILFYDDCIISQENLQIPHPEICKRAFVLEPMVNIAPYFRHPINKKNMKELLEEL